MLGRFIQRGSAPIGLDIGAAGVKLAQLRAAGKAIELTATAAIEKKTTDDPHTPLTQRMIDAIRSRLDTGDFSGRECIITFPDHWLSARSVRLPVMPKDETDAALALEAAERLGFTDETPGEVSWVHAGRVRQGDDWRDEIILVGAEREPLTELVDAVSETGLRPIAVEPSFLATARTYSRRFRRDADRETVRVGLDIGKHNTGVIVLKGTTVAFYKPLRLSGEDFTRAVADRLDISQEDAADLRRQRQADTTGTFDESVDRTIYEAVRPLIEELAKETALCLRYFSVAFTGDRPSLVFTTGDEAHEPNLVQSLGDTLRLEHTVGDPLLGISRGPKARIGTPTANATQWSAAIGLSLRGLPASKRRKGEDTKPILDGPIRKQAA